MKVRKPSSRAGIEPRLIFSRRLSSRRKVRATSSLSQQSFESVDIPTDILERRNWLHHSYLDHLSNRNTLQPLRHNKHYQEAADVKSEVANSENLPDYIDSRALTRRLKLGLVDFEKDIRVNSRHSNLASQRIKHMPVSTDSLQYPESTQKSQRLQFLGGRKVDETEMRKIFRPPTGYELESADFHFTGKRNRVEFEAENIIDEEDRQCNRSKKRSMIKEHRKKVAARRKETFATRKDLEVKLAMAQIKRHSDKHSCKKTIIKKTRKEVLDAIWGQLSKNDTKQHNTYKYSNNTISLKQLSNLQSIMARDFSDIRNFDFLFSRFETWRASGVNNSDVGKRVSKKIFLEYMEHIDNEVTAMKESIQVIGKRSNFPENIDKKALPRSREKMENKIKSASSEKISHKGNFGKANVMKTPQKKKRERQKNVKGGRSKYEDTDISTTIKQHIKSTKAKIKPKQSKYLTAIQKSAAAAARRRRKMAERARARSRARLAKTNEAKIDAKKTNREKEKPLWRRPRSRAYSNHSSASSTTPRSTASPRGRMLDLLDDRKRVASNRSRGGGTRHSRSSSRRRASSRRSNRAISSRSRGRVHTSRSVRGVLRPGTMHGMVLEEEEMGTPVIRMENFEGSDESIEIEYQKIDSSTNSVCSTFITNEYKDNDDKTMIDVRAAMTLEEQQEYNHGFFHKTTETEDFLSKQVEYTRREKEKSKRKQSKKVHGTQKKRPTLEILEARGALKVFDDLYSPVYKHIPHPSLEQNDTPDNYTGFPAKLKFISMLRHLKTVSSRNRVRTSRQAFIEECRSRKIIAEPIGVIRANGGAGGNRQRRIISLRNQSLGDSFVAALASANSIHNVPVELIDLHGNRLCDRLGEGLVRILSDLGKGLKGLDLSENQLGPSSCILLSKTLSCGRAKGYNFLEALNLAGNPLRPMGLVILLSGTAPKEICLRAGPSLNQALMLSNSNLQKPIHENKTISSISKMPPPVQPFPLEGYTEMKKEHIENSKQLNISNKVELPRNVKSKTPLRTLARLRRLCLSRTSIDDESVFLLAQSLASKKIGKRWVSSKMVELDLSWNNISKSVIPLISSVRSLQVLDVSFCSLGSAAPVEDFALKLSNAIANNKTLLHLDMSSCGLTLKHTKVLAEKIERNKTLLGIHLHGNKGYVFVDAYGFLCMVPPVLNLGKIDQNEATESYISRMQNMLVAHKDAANPLQKKEISDKKQNVKSKKAKSSKKKKKKLQSKQGNVRKNMITPSAISPSKSGIFTPEQTDKVSIRLVNDSNMSSIPATTAAIAAHQNIFDQTDSRPWLEQDNILARTKHSSCSQSCWICGSWSEVRIQCSILIPVDTNPCSNVTIHFECDGWQPMKMVSITGNRFDLYRVLPPNRQRFFLCVDGVQGVAAAPTEYEWLRREILPETMRFQPRFRESKTYVSNQCDEEYMSGCALLSGISQPKIMKSGTNVSLEYNNASDCKRQSLQKKRPILLQAVDHINISGILSLLDSGADPNVADDLNSSPLHDACYYGHLEIAKLLITYGANIQQMNARGNTPVHLAFLGNHEPLMSYLLEIPVAVKAASLLNKSFRTAYQLTSIRRFQTHPKNIHLLSQADLHVKKRMVAAIVIQALWRSISLRKSIRLLYPKLSHYTHNSHILKISKREQNRNVFFPFEMNRHSEDAFHDDKSSAKTSLSETKLEQNKVEQKKENNKKSKKTKIKKKQNIKKKVYNKATAAQLIVVHFLQKYTRGRITRNFLNYRHHQKQRMRQGLSRNWHYKHPGSVCIPNVYKKVNSKDPTLSSENAKVLSKQLSSNPKSKKRKKGLGKGKGRKSKSKKKKGKGKMKKIKEKQVDPLPVTPAERIVIETPTMKYNKLVLEESTINIAKSKFALSRACKRNDENCVNIILLTFYIRKQYCKDHKDDDYNQLVSFFDGDETSGHSKMLKGRQIEKSKHNTITAAIYMGAYCMNRYAVSIDAEMNSKYSSNEIPTVQVKNKKQNIKVATLAAKYAVEFLNAMTKISADTDPELKIVNNIEELKSVKAARSHVAVTAVSVGIKGFLQHLKFLEATAVKDTLNLEAKTLAGKTSRSKLRALQEIVVEADRKVESLKDSLKHLYFYKDNLLSKAREFDVDLGNDSSIHERDKLGSTPLIHAGWTGNLKIIKLLLQNGADIFSANNKGDTYAHIIFRKNLAPCIDHFYTLDKEILNILLYPNNLGITPLGFNRNRYIPPHLRKKNKLFGEFSKYKNIIDRFHTFEGDNVTKDVTLRGFCQPVAVQWTDVPLREYGCPLVLQRCKMRDKFLSNSSKSIIMNRRRESSEAKKVTSGSFAAAVKTPEESPGVIPLEVPKSELPQKVKLKKSKLKQKDKRVKLSPGSWLTLRDVHEKLHLLSYIQQRLYNMLENAYRSNEKTFIEKKFHRQIKDGLIKLPVSWTQLDYILHDTLWIIGGNGRGGQEAILIDLWKDATKCWHHEDSTDDINESTFEAPVNPIGSDESMKTSTLRFDGVGCYCFLKSHKKTMETKFSLETSIFAERETITKSMFNTSDMINNLLEYDMKQMLKMDFVVLVSDGPDETISKKAKQKIEIVPNKKSEQSAAEKRQEQQRRRAERKKLKEQKKLMEREEQRRKKIPDAKVKEKQVFLKLKAAKEREAREMAEKEAKERKRLQEEWLGTEENIRKTIKSVIAPKYREILAIFLKRSILDGSDTTGRMPCSSFVDMTINTMKLPPFANLKGTAKLLHESQQNPQMSVQWKCESCWSFNPPNVSICAHCNTTCPPELNAEESLRKAIWAKPEANEAPKAKTVGEITPDSTLAEIKLHETVKVFEAANQNLQDIKELISSSFDSHSEALCSGDASKINAANKTQKQLTEKLSNAKQTVVNAKASVSAAKSNLAKERRKLKRNADLRAVEMHNIEIRNFTLMILRDKCNLCPMDTEKKYTKTAKLSYYSDFDYTKYTLQPHEFLVAILWMGKCLYCDMMGLNLRDAMTRFFSMHFSLLITSEREHLNNKTGVALPLQCIGSLTPDEWRKMHLYQQCTDWFVRRHYRQFQTLFMIVSTRVRLQFQNFNLFFFIRNFVPNDFFSKYFFTIREYSGDVSGDPKHIQHTRLSLKGWLKFVSSDAKLTNLCEIFTTGKEKTNNLSNIEELKTNKLRLAHYIFWQSKMMVHRTDVSETLCSMSFTDFIEATIRACGAESAITNSILPDNEKPLRPLLLRLHETWQKYIIPNAWSTLRKVFPFA